MTDLDRRRFLGAAAATVAASQAGLLVFSRRLVAMTGPMTETQTDVARQVGSSPDIRPFHVSIPEADVADLRRRVKATKWPENETVNDATQGVQSATMHKLAGYWGTDYDWRKAEAKINAVPNFITSRRKRMPCR